jgi:hypothetical protein
VGVDMKRQARKKKGQEKRQARKKKGQENKDIDRHLR